MDIVALLETLVKEIIAAEENFFKNPKNFYELETSVKASAETLKTSYEEATKVIPSKSEITKTTVMNKVHGIAELIPFKEPEEKKKCRYLFVEADEDHVSEQHGRWTKENNGFISRLAYIYEYKQENPKIKGRKELVGTYYFSGLYEGSKGVQQFWEEIQKYIEANYAPDECKECL